MINYADSGERFVTTAQAAQILSVSVSTLKKFILLGKLKAVKTPGGHYRILKKDLYENLYQQSDHSDLAGKGEK
jgi:excisionase family DNA binding protein